MFSFGWVLCFGFVRVVGYYFVRLVWWVLCCVICGLVELVWFDNLLVWCLDFGLCGGFALF